MSEIDWSAAPEGTTHYDMGDSMDDPGFMRKSDRWYFWDGESWEEYGFTESFTLERLLKRVIEKPDKQEEPLSWEGGLPRKAIMVNPHEAPLHYGDEHIGKEVEVIEHLPDESCYVVRFSWGLGVLHDSMIDFGLYDLKSQHERQREELAKLVDENYGYSGAWIADAILSRYTLEPNQ